MAAALLFFSLSSATALEITSLAHGGNILFDKASKNAQESISGTDYYYGLSVFGSQELNENLDLHAGLVYDPVLRYTAYTRFEYSRDFYTISVGPFLGFFNNWQTIMKSGISSSVRLFFPGVAFVSFGSDSSISARFSKKGDYLQEHNHLSVGYYVPNAICSLNLTTKRFVEQLTDDLEVDDSYTEYSFEVDIFQKNVPVQVLLAFSYQQLKRSYSDGQSNTINSLILGTDFDIELSPKLSLLFGLDSNIYSFGKYNDGSGSTALGMPQSGLGVFLFRSNLGLRFSL
ncbi:MAG TPA: hypothetical protein ENN41_08930 [Sediminispirochaeta sp.]|nr:hypothetical protein [Sediminispirochaeta sp.]